MSQDRIEALRTEQYGNENRSWRHPITCTSPRGNTAGLSTLCLLSFGPSVTSSYNAPWLMHESGALTLKCLYSRVCYNGRSYNELILKRTVFINKIRMLHRTRRNTISRRSMRVRMTCRAFPFPLWLERQSSYLLSFVRFSYQFTSVICLFAPLAVKIFWSDNVYGFD